MAVKRVSREVAFLRDLIADEVPEALRRAFNLSPAKWRAAKKDPAGFLREAGLAVPPGITVALERSRSGTGSAAREKMCWSVCIGPKNASTCVRVCGWDDKNSPI